MFHLLNTTRSVQLGKTSETAWADVRATVWAFRIYVSLEESLREGRNERKWRYLRQKRNGVLIKLVWKSACKMNDALLVIKLV